MGDTLKGLAHSIQEDVAGNLTLYPEAPMVAGIPDLCSDRITRGNRYVLAVRSSLLRWRKHSVDLKIRSDPAPPKQWIYLAYEGAGEATSSPNRVRWGMSRLFTLLLCARWSLGVKAGVGGSWAFLGRNCLMAADCVLAVWNLSTTDPTASPNKPDCG